MIESTVDLLMVYLIYLIFLVYSPLKDILTIAEGKGSSTIARRTFDFVWGRKGKNKAILERTFDFVTKGHRAAM